VEWYWQGAFKVKGKAIPIKAWTAPEGSRKLRHMKLVRLSALSTSLFNPPGYIPGTHFCYRLSRPHGNSDANGKRNHDLLACSAVPQPTAPPCAPAIKVIGHTHVPASLCPPQIPQRRIWDWTRALHHETYMAEIHHSKSPTINLKFTNSKWRFHYITRVYRSTPSQQHIKQRAKCK
jgi:hypothetical protein